MPQKNKIRSPICPNRLNVIYHIIRNVIFEKIFIEADWMWEEID